MESLWITIAHRPYVFLFFLCFFILSTLHVGILRTILWGFVGFVVAFGSEYSSIRNGFPYGLYHYIYESLQGEFLLGGIPVWDSLSYVFIAYASFATAWFYLEPLEKKFAFENYIIPSRPLALIFLGAFLMMIADVIIDPVANLGERWFLGKIYFYPSPGIYFGIPLSNFAGWFLVAFVIFCAYQILETHILSPLKLPTWGGARFPYQALAGPLFYFGIVGINLGITYWIGEILLAIVGSLLILTLVVFLSLKITSS